MLGAALVAAVLVPAASGKSAPAPTIPDLRFPSHTIGAMPASLTGAARHHHAKSRLKIAIVPLPKSVIGPAAASLTVIYSSGPLSNSDAAQQSNGFVSPRRLKRLGRVTGYTLGYGDLMSGGTGVTQVVSGVEEYKTAADAKKGLAFWKKDDAKVTEFHGPTLATTNAPVKLPAIGAGHYAFLTTFTVPTVNPIYTVVERVAQGRFVLDLDVSAASVAAAKQLAPVLARKLDRRLRLMLAHRLKGRPVGIPFPPDGGPPPGGPDLSTLIVQPSDVGQDHIVNLLQGYGTNPPAISGYSMLLTPAGPYDLLQQEIDWYPNATEATYEAAFQLASFYEFAAFPGGGGITSVDVSGAGDGAQAAMMTGGGLGEVVLARGPAVDMVIVIGDSFTASNLQNLAYVTADRLDPGIPG